MSAGKTAVQVLDGAGTIGGNKIAVHLASDKTILLDFGWNFRVDHDFLDGFMKIRKSQALWDGACIGELPPATGRLAGLYREDMLRFCNEKLEQRYGAVPGEPRHVTDLLLSHAHADHVGDVGYLHGDIRVACSRPTRLILDHLDTVSQGVSCFTGILAYEPMFQQDYSQRDGITRAGPRKKAKAPRSFVMVDAGEALACGKDSCVATSLPVDHSIPGATAWLIEDSVSGARVVYTGDFRFHGPMGADSRAFIEQAARFNPDALIIEGTRLDPAGDRDEHASEGEVEDRLAGIIASVPVTANVMTCFECSPRDAWRLRSFHKACVSSGKTLVLDAKAYDLLDRFVKAGLVDGIDMSTIRYYLPRKGWGTYESEDYAQSKAIKHATVLFPGAAITAADIAEAPGRHVVYLPFYAMIEFFDLQPAPGSTYIISKSEPFNDEGLIEERKRENWLRLLGFPGDRVFRVHCSGHARRADLVEAITTIAPRVVIPVHTEHPGEFARAGLDAGIRVEVPERGQIYLIR